MIDFGINQRYLQYSKLDMVGLLRNDVFNKHVEF